MKQLELQTLMALRQALMVELNLKFHINKSQLATLFGVDKSTAGRIISSRQPDSKQVKEIVKVVFKNHD